MMIEVKNLKKVYRSDEKETVALNNISFSVEKGEMIAIIGPDGAGKSTLIKSLCGIIPFDEGSISICDMKLPDDFKKIRLILGYLSQNFTLYRNLTVYENIDYFASLFEITNKKQKITDILKNVGLYEFKDRLAKDLSGGMKQKLSVATALIRSPQIILLDEPTTGVDPLSRREMMNIISEKKKEGLTVIFSTSYMDEAELSDRVIMLNTGNIAGDLYVDELFKKDEIISITVDKKLSFKPDNLLFFYETEDKTLMLVRRQNLKIVEDLLACSGIIYRIKRAGIEEYFISNIANK